MTEDINRSFGEQHPCLADTTHMFYPEVHLQRCDATHACSKLAVVELTVRNTRPVPAGIKTQTFLLLTGLTAK